MNPGEFRMVAKTMQGLEGVLAKEIAKIGGREVEEHKRAVSFVGDKGTMYKANYLLRTALRVLMPVASFTVRDEKEFYDGIRAIDWEQWLGADDIFANALIFGQITPEIVQIELDNGLRIGDLFVLQIFKIRHDDRDQFFRARSSDRFIFDA